MTNSALGTRTQHATRNTQQAILVAFLGGAGLAGYALWLLDAQLGRGQAGWDFRAYYAAAQAIQHGANLYALDSPATPFYLYPPTLAALLVPLTPLSLGVAWAAWFVGQHLVLGLAGLATLRLVARATGWGAWGPAGLGLGLLVALWGLGVPWHEEVYLGQVNTLVLALVAGGLVLAGVGGARPSWAATAAAGLCLGLAAAVKVFPALLLPWLLWRGRPGVALAGGATFLALQAGTGLLTVGPTGYSSTLDYWFSLFPDLLHRPAPYLDNQSLNGLLARLLLPPTDPALPAVGDDPRLWALLTAAGSLLFLAATVLLIARGDRWPRRRRPPGPPVRVGLTVLLELGLLLITINIISGITWPHHLLWWVLPALALVAGRMQGAPIPRWMLVVVAAVAGVLALSPNDWLDLAATMGDPRLTALGTGVHLYALLALWAILAVALRRTAVRAASKLAPTPAQHPPPADR